MKAFPDFDNKLFLNNYILHAQYRRFPINTQLTSRPEKVCVFMIAKNTFQFSKTNKLMVLIRIV